MRAESHIELSVAARNTCAPLPIIALGSGVTLAAVLNVLRHNGIPVYALCPENDFVRRSRWYRALPTALPNPGPADLEALLDSLELGPAVLLPCSDDWLRAVAALSPDLKRRFTSSISPECVDLLTNKWRFADLLEQFGIPRPRTQLISSLDQFDNLPDVLLNNAILKPLSSVDFAGKYGVKGYLVTNRHQANDFIEQLELPVMLQEFIPGPPSSGYFIDGFRDRAGRIAGLFARRRLRMHPARLGNSTFLESVPLSAVHGALAPLLYLLERISYRGVFSAEFKLDDRDAAFKLIEINARPWWYVEFASQCGVDVCTMAYRDALGLPVAPVEDYEVDRRCIFHLNDLRSWKHRHYDYIPSLEPLLRSWIYSNSTPFHWNDPAPALAYLFRTLAEFLRASPKTAPRRPRFAPQDQPRYLRSIATPRPQASEIGK